MTSAWVRRNAAGGVVDRELEYICRRLLCDRIASTGERVRPKACFGCCAGAFACQTWCRCDGCGRKARAMRGCLSTIDRVGRHTQSTQARRTLLLPRARASADELLVHRRPVRPPSSSGWKRLGFNSQYDVRTLYRLLHGYLIKSLQRP